MLKDGLIDEEIIHNFGQGILLGLAWDKWKPFILEYRERINAPWHMSGLEYVAMETKRWRKERGWPLGRGSDDWLWSK